MKKPVSLRLQLDFRSGLPAYLQIVRQVERLLASGRIKAGDRLPTVRDLAVGLGLNFNTVARAYRLMGASGLLSTQRGRGTYMVERRPASDAGRGRLEALQAIARRCAEDTARYGFSAAEVRAALNAELELRDRPR